MAGPYQCVQVDPSGFLIIDEGVNTDSPGGGCYAGYAIATQEQIEEFGGPLPPLTPAEAMEIAACIGALWAFGWGIRQLIKVARSA